jgi:hypothetical protein
MMKTSLILLGMVGALVGTSKHGLSPESGFVRSVRWPRDSALSIPPNTPVVVMFSDFSSSCASTDLDELRSLLGPFAGRIAVRLLSSNAPEAARFGVRTPGEVLVYSAAGDLRYSGSVSHAHALTAMLERATNPRTKGPLRITTPIVACPR